MPTEGVAIMDKYYLRAELRKIKRKMNAVNRRLNPAYQRLATAKAQGSKAEIAAAENALAELSREFDEQSEHGRILMEQATAENPTGPQLP